MRKNKLLLIITTVLFNYASSQTSSQLEFVKQSYDQEKLKELHDIFRNEYLKNFNIGKSILKRMNIPIFGVDSDSSFYSMRGYDPDTKQVIFFKTHHKKINNTDINSSIKTSRVQKLHNGQAIGIEISGDYMILGIWDGGQPLSTHQNLGTSRVINKDNELTTGNTAAAQQNGINHATHVSGTMIGNGIEKNIAKGIAFKSKLWANTWDNDISEMTLEASEGLLVSNHSYGVNNRAYINLPGTFGRYTAISKRIDQLTYQADMYLPVFSAGNDRGGIVVSGNIVYLNPSKQGYDLLTHEMVAKNPVIVAAVNGISEYIFTNYSTNNIVMSNFSQWGPTDDFRIKPDISAKGVQVYSSTGISQDSYVSLSGTSMAAPSVSGVFILWQNIHSLLWPNANNNSGFMKAASLKALMAHTASEAGDQEGPDPKFGWGLINAEMGAQILKKSNENQAVFKELIMSNLQTHEYVVTVDGTEPLIATIAWTDSASEPVEVSESPIPLLINDLDIRLIRTVNNHTIYPWTLNKSWTNIYALRADNNVDPIEKITYHNPNTLNAEAGEYKLVITHKNTLPKPINFSVLISGGLIDSQHTVNNETFEKEKIILFPNPSNDFIYITRIDHEEVDITDTLGKKIKVSIQDDDNFFKIDISKLTVGVYYLNIKTKKNTTTSKFIKK